MYENFMLNHDTRIPIPSAPIHQRHSISAIPSAPIVNAHGAQPPIATNQPPCEENLVCSQMKKHLKDELKKNTKSFNVSRKTRIFIMWILLALFAICAIASFVLGFMDSLVPFYVIGTLSAVSIALLISLERVIQRMLKTTEKKEKIREILATINILPPNGNDHLSQRIFELNRD